MPCRRVRCWPRASETGIAFPASPHALLVVEKSSHVYQSLACIMRACARRSGQQAPLLLMQQRPSQRPPPLPDTGRVREIPAGQVLWRTLRRPEREGNLQYELEETGVLRHPRMARRPQTFPRRRRVRRIVLRRGQRPRRHQCLRHLARSLNRSKSRCTVGFQ